MYLEVGAHFIIELQPVSQVKHGLQVSRVLLAHQICHVFLVEGDKIVSRVLVCNC